MSATGPPPRPSSSSSTITPSPSSTGCSTSSDVQSMTIRTRAEQFMRLIAQQRALATQEARDDARKELEHFKANVGVVQAEHQRRVNALEAEVRVLRAERDRQRTANEVFVQTLGAVSERVARYNAGLAEGGARVLLELPDFAQLGLASGLVPASAPEAGSGSDAPDVRASPQASSGTAPRLDQGDAEAAKWKTRCEVLQRENDALKARPASAEHDRSAAMEQALRERVAILESMAAASSLTANTQNLPDLNCLNEELSSLIEQKTGATQDAASPKKRRLDETGPD